MPTSTYRYFYVENQILTQESLKSHPTLTVEFMDKNSTVVLLPSRQPVEILHTIVEATGGRNDNKETTLKTVVRTLLDFQKRHSVSTQ